MKEMGHYLKYGENYSISISTPIMQRAIKLPQASEMIFVDATGNCDVQDHKVYFLLRNLLWEVCQLGAF